MKKLMVIVAALAMITGSAYAADWNFYGHARVSTFYADVDGAADGVFSEGLQGNSRVGANVKVNDELTGKFEFGASESTVNTRVIWGEWNFGGGSFGVGQNYTPLNLFYSNQVYGGDADLLNTGGVYSGRNPMLRLKFGDFQIAAVKPSAGNIDVPTIEAKYALNLGAAKIAFAGGYDVGPDNGDSAWVLALGAKLNLGGFSLGGNIYTGDNAEAMMWTEGAGDSSLGYILVAGFTVNDMFKLELGYGHVEGDNSLDAESYYVQAPITLAPGVYVTPEIGRTDINDVDTDYFGAKWQINF